jgi:hypothetical protein
MKNRSRAHPPDPNESLFKFKLTFASTDKTQAPTVQTWYSYDYLDERGLFPKGLSKQMRACWKQLLDDCWKNAQLYETVKWLRPVADEQSLHLYLPNWSGYLSKLKLVEDTLGWSALESAVKNAGYDDFLFRSVQASHPRQPSDSPGRKDFTSFYGFQYLQRNNFIVDSLHCGKIIKIDIYDNLMYHTENHLHTLMPSGCDNKLVRR